MGFFRQEYWSALPFPPPGDLPDPDIEPTPPVSYFAGGFFAIEASLLIIREMQIKTTSHRSEGPSSKILQTINSG